MNKIFTFEMTHLASADYDSLVDHRCTSCLTSDCGTLEEHLKRNSCPKKHGVIGDCHYELYVQQDVIAKTEEEAQKKLTLEKNINDHLKTVSIKEFNASDFDFDCISSKSTTDEEGISEMRIVHEKVYYDNE